MNENDVQIDFSEYLSINDLNNLRNIIENNYSKYNLNVKIENINRDNEEVTIITLFSDNDYITLEYSIDDGIIIFYSSTHFHIEGFEDIIKVINNIIIEKYYIYHYYFDKNSKKWVGSGYEKSIDKIISMENVFEWETPFREGNRFYKKFNSIEIKQWCKNKIKYIRKNNIFKNGLKDYFEIANGI